MSNFLNNTSDLEKIYNEIEGIDELMTEQDNLIAQITTALDGKTGDSSAPTYTTIETTVTLSGIEVVIPDLIGKTFFIIAVDDTMPLKSVKPEDEEIFELVYMNGQFYKSGSELFGTQFKFLTPVNATFNGETGTILFENSDHIFQGVEYKIYAC